MTNKRTTPNGFIVEASDVPATLVENLERRGLATMSSRTVEGLYFEPAGRLSELIAALEDAGVAFTALRSAASAETWTRGGEPTVRRNRLRNPLSACWLPTWGRAGAS